MDPFRSPFIPGASYDAQQQDETATPSPMEWEMEQKTPSPMEVQSETETPPSAERQQPSPPPSSLPLSFLFPSSSSSSMANQNAASCVSSPFLSTPHQISSLTALQQQVSSPTPTFSAPTTLFHRLIADAAAPLAVQSPRVFERLEQRDDQEYYRRSAITQTHHQATTTFHVPSSTPSAFIASEGLASSSAAAATPAARPTASRNDSGESTAADIIQQARLQLFQNRNYEQCLKFCKLASRHASCTATDQAWVSFLRTEISFYKRNIKMCVRQCKEGLEHAAAACSSDNISGGNIRSATAKHCLFMTLFYQRLGECHLERIKRHLQRGGRTPEWDLALEAFDRAILASDNNRNNEANLENHRQWLIQAKQLGEEKMLWLKCSSSSGPELISTPSLHRKVISFHVAVTPSQMNICEAPISFVVFLSTITISMTLTNYMNQKLEFYKNRIDYK